MDAYSDCNTDMHDNWLPYWVSLKNTGALLRLYRRIPDDAVVALPGILFLVYLLFPIRS